MWTPAHEHILRRLREVACLIVLVLRVHSVEASDHRPEWLSLKRVVVLLQSQLLAGARDTVLRPHLQAVLVFEHFDWESDVVLVECVWIGASPDLGVRTLSFVHLLSLAGELALHSAVSVRSLLKLEYLFSDLVRDWKHELTSEAKVSAHALCEVLR